MSKLILTNEVSGLGSAGDVVEVKNGFARNYLLPRGFAVLWTKGGEKQVEQIKQIVIPVVLTIKELADKMKIVPSVIVKKLFMQGELVPTPQPRQPDGSVSPRFQAQAPGGLQRIEAGRPAPRGWRGWLLQALARCTAALRSAR